MKADGAQFQDAVQPAPGGKVVHSGFEARIRGVGPGMIAAAAADTTDTVESRDQDWANVDEQRERSWRCMRA